MPCGIFSQKTITQQWKMKKLQLHAARCMYLKNLVFNLRKQVAQDYLQ